MGKQQGKIYFSYSSKTITDKGLDNSSAQIIPAQSIVYSSRAPIGYINIVNREYTTNQGCKSLFPIIIEPEFVYWLIKERTKNIEKRASGTTFKEISGFGFGETIVSIPPIEEQRRITIKINLLFTLANNYQQKYTKKLKLDVEFPEKLRKSILQYAMQGKLVKQDPNDEPVEVLLDKIRTEKQRLYREGKLKKKDLEENIIYKGDDNLYYMNIINLKHLS